MKDAAIESATSRTPVLSVIVATRNVAPVLQGLLDSLAAQTFRDFEVLVSDGASDDDTLSILERSATTLPLTVVSRSDAGIYDAWNRALVRAKGTWVCFLGADDRLADASSLSRLVRAAEGAPAAVGVVYGRVALVAESGLVLQILGEPWETVRLRFRQVMCVPHPGAMHRRALFERHGPFDPRYRIAGDYEWLLRELKDHDALFVPETTVRMRFGGVSARPERFLEALREVRRAQRENGIPGPGGEWWLAWTRAWLRRLLVAVLGEAGTRRLMDAGRRLRGLPPLWTRLG